MSETNRKFTPKNTNAYRSWIIWNSIPRHLTPEHLEQLSINDPELAVLAAIKTQGQLAKHLKVRPATITLWAKQPIPDEYKELDWRYWAKKATPIVVAKYLDKLTKHADAARFTAWMKYVEQVEEKTSQRHTDADGEKLIGGWAGKVAEAEKVLKDHGESID